MWGISFLPPHGTPWTVLLWWPERSLFQLPRRSVPVKDMYITHSSLLLLQHFLCGNGDYWEEVFSLWGISFPPPHGTPCTVLLWWPERTLFQMTISVADRKYKRRATGRTLHTIKLFSNTSTGTHSRLYLRNTHLDIRENEAAMFANVDPPHSTVPLPPHQQEITD